MNLTELVQTARLRPWLAATAVILVLIVVFAAGVLVGYQKAQFSYRWGENYYRNIVGPPSAPFGQPFLAAHDSQGQILQINNNQLVVKGTDGVEKNIIVGSQTTIRKGTSTIKISDLHDNDNIIAIGDPTSQGQLAAKFIRVLGY